VAFFEPPPPPPEPPDVNYVTAPWLGPPDEEVGAPVPLRLVLARTPDVAVAVVGVVAYSTGMAFDLEVIRRTAPREPFFDPFGTFAIQRGELPDEVVRFGVEFADGRKVTTVARAMPPSPDEVPDTPVLTPWGGGGGGRRWTFQLWLWPLRAPGRLDLVVEWPSEGIGLTRHTLDAGAIVDAAAVSERLWDDDAPRAGGAS
jgi:hypothetical protein